MEHTNTAPSGRDYNKAFETVYDPSVGLRQGGVSDRLRDRLVREERDKLTRQGWHPATVVNLLPFPLHVNLGELGVIEVPAATPERPVAREVIRHHRMSMRDMGDGNFSPVSVLPIELANEVKLAYADSGGVFCQTGDGEIAESEIHAAREQLANWYRREFQKAVDAWSRYHQHKFITDRQRDAARELFRTGEIAEMPEWVTITRAQSDRRECPMCGEDIKVVAKICRFCHSDVSGEGRPDTPAPAQGKAGRLEKKAA